MVFVFWDGRVWNKIVFFVVLCKFGREKIVVVEEVWEDRRDVGFWRFVGFGFWGGIGGEYWGRVNII